MINPVTFSSPLLATHPAQRCIRTGAVPGAEDVHIWLDLGGVIIGSRGSRGIGFKDKEPLRFMPGAYAYLKRLITAGYTIGAITNIPEDFGIPGDRASKIAALKKYVADNWADPDHTFDWSVFDHVLIPLWDSERKPAAKLFIDARRISEGMGQVGFYQAETCSEVVASAENGIPAFQVTYRGNGAPIFLPVAEIPDFVDDPEPPHCFLP